MLFFFDSYAVIILIRFPRLQIDLEIDFCFRQDRADAEHSGYIDDTDSTNFQHFPQQLRSLPYNFVVDSITVHSVIRHQQVTALDQLQCDFTFPHSAFPANQYTFSIDGEQSSVNAHTGCQLLIQKRHDIDNQTVGRGAG